MRPERKNLHHRQGGVALIVVLLVFAIVTVVAASMVERSFLNIRRTERQLVYAQAWQYALAGEAFARQMLHTDFPDEEQDKDDSRGDIAEQGGLLLKMVEEFEQGEMDIAIFDLQAKFNINNLVGKTTNDSKRASRQFDRLLGNLSVEPKIIETLQDWVRSYDRSAAINTEDLPPEQVCTYSWTNWLITHLSELYLLGDMNRETVDKMAPYLTVLPAPTKINVDTAPAPVFQMMDGIDKLGAERIIDERGSDGFASVDAFMKATSTAALNPNPDDFTIKSNYFAALVKSTFADQAISLLTVFYRHPETHRIRVLSRDRSDRFSFNAPADPDKA